MPRPISKTTFKEKEKLYSEFEQQALPHIDVLYNFALRMTCNKKDAAKLLKETYSKAFWFFEKLEKETNYKMWLFRVMRNAYLNSYSKKSKKIIETDYEEAEKFYENIKASLKESSQLEKEIYNKLSENELSESLSSLPEDLRIVIILCDIEKFNYEEMADFIDVPIGVIMSRLNRARKIFFTNIYKS